MTSNDIAADYTKLHAQVTKQIEALTDAIDDHAAGLQPDEVTWGHIGGLTKVAIDIDNATRFLSGLDR